ncbi:MAG: sigma-70 family RNA polymerase sigma factor [Fimbriimonadaceae bacterium]|nr:sigma-70 family RNA polymerase sigma factor [Fimbriimonadaceae bacterium]
MIHSEVADGTIMVTTSNPNDSIVRTDEEYRRFQGMIDDTRRRAYTMALQLTRNSSDAEDLMQDTFVKAWRGFDSYIPGRPFLNWLLRIMQRAYLDSRRRENPIRKADSLHNMVSPSDGEVQELPIADESPTPDQELIRDEFRAELQAALNELPDVYRTAIVMCDLDGLSYSEIADVQRTTIGTVRSRIHRGRRLLRDIVLRRGFAL